MILQLVGFLLIIPVMFFLSLALFIGYNRYAAEGNTTGLFALGDNLQLAWQNAGQGCGLYVRLFVVGVVNLLVAGVVQLLISWVFPQQLSFGQEPTTAFWIGFALTQLITYTVSLIFIVSQYHLVASYGLAVGVLPDIDRPTTNTGVGPWIILGVILALVLLLGVVVLITLSVMGPVIQEVYTELMLTLTPMPR